MSPVWQVLQMLPVSPNVTGVTVVTSVTGVTSEMWFLNSNSMGVTLQLVKMDNCDHCYRYIHISAVLDTVNHYRHRSVASILIAVSQERRLTGLDHTYQTGSSMSSLANITLFVHHVLQVCRKDRSWSDPFFLHNVWLHLVTSSQHTVSNTINTLMTHSCFFALKAAIIDTDIHLLESRSQAVKRWSLGNDLMLNADKSEVML